MNRFSVFLILLLVLLIHGENDITMVDAEICFTLIGSGTSNCKPTTCDRDCKTLKGTNSIGHCFGVGVECKCDYLC
ncbi:hypothetical protein ACOSP7_022202 [Xanthoceras sorbifolium]